MRQNSASEYRLGRVSAAFTESRATPSTAVKPKSASEIRTGFCRIDDLRECTRIRGTSHMEQVWPLEESRRPITETGRGNRYSEAISERMKIAHCPPVLHRYFRVK